MQYKIHIATHGEKGEAATIAVCMISNGSNWILRMAVYGKAENGLSLSHCVPGTYIP
jgi:hypothetical protein